MAGIFYLIVVGAEASAGKIFYFVNFFKQIVPNDKHINTQYRKILQNNGWKVKYELLQKPLLSKFHNLQTELK